ncbi:MAG: hypothetical protein HZY75_04235 [Nocardioidaceae bacterium]|nr:MAG: hypothetical protein HZY75_04235 [Nocardioidaceae bacterium]
MPVSTTVLPEATRVADAVADTATGVRRAWIGLAFGSLFGVDPVVASAVEVVDSALASLVAGLGSTALGPDTLSGVPVGSGLGFELGLGMGMGPGVSFVADLDRGASGADGLSCPSIAGGRNAAADSGEDKGATSADSTESAEGTPMDPRTSWAIDCTGSGRFCV